MYTNSIKYILKHRIIYANSTEFEYIHFENRIVNSTLIENIDFENEIVYANSRSFKYIDCTKTNYDN